MSRYRVIGAVVAVVLLAFSAVRVQAQADIAETVALKATIVVQNTNSQSTPGAPTTLKFTTKELLALLAKDENAAGNYGATNFPSGAKLVKFGSDFSVVDSANNDLVDTFIITMSPDFGVFTAAGADDGSAPYTETDYGYVDFFIYDLDIPGGVTDLTMSGYFINTIKNSAANQSTGEIKSSQAFTMKAGGGTGSVNSGDENAVINGSLTAKGTGTTF